MEPVKVRVEYSADDYARATMFVQRQGQRFARLLLFGIVGVVALLFFAATLRKSNPNVGPGYFLFVIGTPIAMAVIIIQLSTRVINPWLFRRAFSKQIESSPMLQEPKEIEFNEIGVEGSTFFGGGVTKWGGFIEVKETDTDFHFFTSPKASQFVPKSAFKDEGEIERLRQLVIDRIGDRAHVN